uniref:Late embryogenesis abundant protein LEA-2 subgroup domain-containing protein n=1 Tax=Vitis vinifera TaxID=29760 RepID=F6H6L0_VITVI
MAQKKQQVHPIEPTGGPAKTDVESEELRRMKCTRYIAYLSAFALFETIVIMVCVVTLMRIRSPKFRFRAVSIENLNYTSDTTSPSFNIRFNAKVAVKNTNFGHFKFKNSTITLAYRGDHVGDAKISKARARARSTKKMNELVKYDLDIDIFTKKKKKQQAAQEEAASSHALGFKQLVKCGLDIDIFTKKKKKK